MNFICEGLDRLGKDTLLQGIQNARGYHTFLHRSKPLILKFYEEKAQRLGKTAQFWYQVDCFSSDMALLKFSETADISIIFNRSWIGEAVYAGLYRGYNGDYVFDLEKIAGVKTLRNTRLILLVENFEKSYHFVDDGQSLGPAENRLREQQLFIDAFNKSHIVDKRIIDVTGPDGSFRSKESILADALA